MASRLLWSAPQIAQARTKPTRLCRIAEALRRILSKPAGHQAESRVVRCGGKVVKFTSSTLGILKDLFQKATPERPEPWLNGRTGSPCRAVKPDAKSTEPAHHLCANCFERERNHFFSAFRTALRGCTSEWEQFTVAPNAALKFKRDPNCYCGYAAETN